MVAGRRRPRADGLGARRRRSVLELAPRGCRGPGSRRVLISDAAPQFARRVQRYAGLVGSGGSMPFAPRTRSRSCGDRPGLDPLDLLLGSPERRETSRAPELERGAGIRRRECVPRPSPAACPGQSGTAAITTSDLAGRCLPLRALINGFGGARARRSFPSTTKSRSIRSPGACARPASRIAIKRTLLLRVRPGRCTVRVSPNSSACCLLMPSHIGAIRNWCLSRAHGSRKGWTHVWEQDFAELSGLTDDYMNHPIHWSVVDPLVPSGRPALHRRSGARARLLPRAALRALARARSGVGGLNAPRITSSGTCWAGSRAIELNLEDTQKELRHKRRLEAEHWRGPRST